MKKLLLILLQLILCSVFCKAQQAPPSWLWLKGSGGGSGYEYGGGIGTDDSGYVYIGGRFNGQITFAGLSGNVQETAGGTNHLYGKFDENGNCIWLSQNAIGFDYPRGFCTDRAKNNNEYQDGNTNSGAGLFVEKVNNNGVVQWSTTLGNNGNGYGSAPNGDGVAADTAGDVYITGETGGGSWTFVAPSVVVDDDSTLTCGTNGFWPHAQEMFLAKLDKGGNLLWAVGAEDANGLASYDVGRDVTLSRSGPYVFVCGGYENTPVFHSRNPSTYADITVPTAASGTSNFFVAKYDTAGNLLFVSTATNAGIPWISGFNSGVGAVNAVAVDSCDDIFVTGYFQGIAQFGPNLSLTSVSGSGYNDGFVASCNSKGQWQWVDDIGSASTLDDYGQNIALDKDNDVYVGGVIYGTANFGNGVSVTASSSQGSLFLAKYANSNGVAQWAQGPTGSSQTGVSGLAIDTQKFVYICGSFNGTMTLGGTTVSASTGNGNIFIAKLDTVPALYIVPVVSADYCAGETTTIPYTIQGTFNNGNFFTAELSDSTGSFVDNTVIGMVTSTTNGSITVIIPAGIPQGSTYLIRVVSSNPATSSYVNGCGAYYQPNVYIDNFYVTIGSNISVAVTPVDTNLCSGGAVKLSAGGTGLTYKWYSNTDTSTLATTDTFIVNPTTTTTYYVAVSNSSNCSGVDSSVVNISAPPPFTITPASALLCPGTNATLKVDTTGTNYIWIPSLGLSVATGDSVIAYPSTTTTYTVTGKDSLGCAVTDSVIVTVSNNVTLTILPQPPPLFCSGLSAELQVSGGGSGFTWIPSPEGSTSTGDSILASPTITTTYTVLGNDSAGCSATGIEVVTVIASPNQPTFYQHGDTLTSSSTTDNQWYMNGLPLSGDTSQNLIINNTSPAEYWVVVENEANGCSTASDSEATTGINQLSVISHQVSIYPNPFNNDLFIRINSSAQDVKDWNLQVVDVLGRTVYSQQSLNYSNNIDLSNLSSGVYFITVINKTNRAVFPVVKQN